MKKLHGDTEPNHAWSYRIAGFLARQSALILCLVLLLSLPSLIPVSDGVSFTLPRFMLTVSQSVCIATALAAVIDLLRWGWLKWTIVVIISFLFVFNSGVAVSQSMQFDGRTLRLVLQTNTGETAEFIDNFLFNWHTVAIISTLAVIILLYAFAPANRTICSLMRHSSAGVRLLVWAVGVCEVLSVCTLVYMTWFRTPPTTPAYTTVQQVVYAIAHQESHRETVEMLRQSNAQAAITSVEATIPTIVLVIGESHSRLHSQIYGYPKPNMPLLTQAEQNGDIVVMDSVMSRHSVTFEVIPEIYSTHDPEAPDDWRAYPLVQALFKKAGYEVEVYDNQGLRAHVPVFLDYDVDYFLNDDSIHHQCFSYRNDKLFAHDGDLVDYSLKNSRQGSRRLVIYHLNGQHFKAVNRYPADFGKFTPQDYDSLRYTLRQRIDLACYDNATLYLDTVLSRIFSAYSHEDAVVLYMPDHGEEIHDFRDFYGRTAEIPNSLTRECLLHVPMIVYASPSIREKRPSLWQHITDAKGRRWSNSYAAHQLLELAGISSPTFNPRHVLFYAE